MAQAAQVIILTLIILCPVFTILFAFDLGFVVQLTVSLAVALAAALLVMGRSGRGR